MFDINEILKLSEKMGVKIEDSTSGKHYILNEIGEAVEFNTNMLMGEKTKRFSYAIKSKSFEVDLELSNSVYNFSSTDSIKSYTSIPVNNSIIDAA